MNEQIIDNLFEFWEHIGQLTNSLTKHNSYSAVKIEGSDWPNRVFNFQPSLVELKHIDQLSLENDLPQTLTFSQAPDLPETSSITLRFKQVNMALKLTQAEVKSTIHNNIKRVSNAEDAIAFAHTASTAFGYNVGSNVIQEIIKQSDKTDLFLYSEYGQSLGCGLVTLTNGTMPDYT